jgi:cupin fold WbuC family metalloprotein
MPTVQVITETLFDSVSARAEASPRRRMNHNFHSGHEDNPHRFLNVLLKGTYIQPHRHIDPPKTETFIVLEGEAEVLIFNSTGEITNRFVLGRSSPSGKSWGIDLAPEVWHTIIPITERVICFEVKPGPWEPANDKDFAPWAPKEGEAEAAAYLASLARTA